MGIECESILNNGNSFAIIRVRTHDTLRNWFAIIQFLVHRLLRNLYQLFSYLFIINFRICLRTVVICYILIKMLAISHLFPRYLFRNL
jgi:hypothetical protein